MIRLHMVTFSEDFLGAVLSFCTNKTLVFLSVTMDLGSGISMHTATGRLQGMSFRVTQRASRALSCHLLAVDFPGD